MQARKLTKTARASNGRMLLARRGDRWDELQVADHLMSCRAQMVCGLRRKPPWAGLDADTLDSCFGLGAAVIVGLAASGERPDWRSVDDLEKAQIAAFRNQVFDHWKRVNALSRRGDRVTVAFDPERHAAPDTQMERLFAQPDLSTVRRDLLAELVDPALRAFWTLVLDHGLTFKESGDRLDLTKAQVMARTRAGRFVFAGYLVRRESGELCSERGADIAARRAGTADAAGVERAAAHLDACYACALVHQPGAGAFERGVLTLAPFGLLVRLKARAADLAAVPVTRWAEAAAGARLAAGGLAALAVAGTTIGVQAATSPERPAAAAPAPVATVTRAAPVAEREAFRAPALLLAAPPAAGSAALGRARPDAGAATREARRRARPEPSRPVLSTQPRETPTPAPGPEFSVEAPLPPVRTAPPAPTTPPSPPAEFASP